MLTKSFSIADPLLQEFLDHRADPNGYSWFEHCMAKGWTVERMMSGFEGWKEDRVTVDHEPIVSTPRSSIKSLEKAPHA
jgi:hypothetical protein